ncbi:mCG63843, isoform CRA_a [Mus musculus]|nr:mCG63843, isoform CRA_a [Mus musculus]EDL02656.1 mCG63843, isoform CRA_a [Mus musculus]
MPWKRSPSRQADARPWPELHVGGRVTSQFHAPAACYHASPRHGLSFCNHKPK